MTEPSKSDVLPSTSKNSLIRLAVALGLALICWPTALYALHGYLFRSAEAESGNGQIIFAGVTSLIAIISTWMAVFLLSSGQE